MSTAAAAPCPLTSAIITPKQHTEFTSLLEMREVCEHLGLGVDLLTTPDSPRHVEMLTDFCASQGWKPGEFHVYRRRVEYPILRSSVRIDFDLSSKV